MTTPAIAAITFDCADAFRQATFWSEALGRPVADGASADYASLEGAPVFAFVAVPEPKTSKNRMHLDLDVHDLPAEVGRLVGLGATRLGDFDENGYTWTTLADPEGNEFDLVAAA